MKQWKNIFMNGCTKIFRNIHKQKQPPKVFYNKRCFKKFRKIRKKTPVPESFFNKVAGLRSANLLKRDSDTCVFLWILRNLKEQFFLQSTSWRLLLHKYIQRKTPVITYFLVQLQAWAFRVLRKKASITDTEHHLFPRIRLLDNCFWPPTLSWTFISNRSTMSHITAH